MTWQRITQISICVAIPVWGLYDLAAYFFSGNDATVSKQILDAAQAYPLVIVLVSVSLGVFLGHLFVPQHLPAKEES